MQRIIKILIGKLILGRIPILSSIAWRLREAFLPKGTINTRLVFSDHSIEINPRSFMGMHLFFNGVWEGDVTSFVLKMSKKKVIIDVGAHIGYYVLLFNEILEENGQIIAFEPGLDGVDRLLKSNVQNLNNTTIEKHGLSDISEMSFMKGDRIVKESQEYDLTISTITFDEYVQKNEIERVDLIKIDIEGYELKALYGMKNVLKILRPNLIIEIHPDLLQRLNQTYEDLRNYLKAFDYSINLISRMDATNFTIFCEKH